MNSVNENLNKEISFYRANVSLNKNEMLHFEANTKKKLIKNMKDTLSSNRFKNDKINEIYIYALKEVDKLSYEDLLNK